MNIKHIFATAALTLAATLVSAQSLFVHKADGTVHEYALDEVSQVSFGESTGKQDIRTITYFANDGTETSQTSESHVAKPAIVGEDIAFTREGYFPSSWNTKPDGSGATFVTGEPCVSPTSLALYAQWKPISGTENGHEWVDLGLPSGTKWATTNVGADTPEAYGSYFAWGETEPKTDYSWSTYKHGKAEDALTKYCTDSDYGKDGYKDDLTVLEKSDDAASVNWGGNWRTPTVSELQELLDEDYCTSQPATQSGVPGFLITSKSNGASIFLPAAGYYTETTLQGLDIHGSYMSASVGNNLKRAFGCGFWATKDLKKVGECVRYYSFSVRPVCQ